jgi:non-ribosomal peptide synthetase component F
VLLAAFAALGHELTGSPVIAPHCGIANRVEACFENVVGVFTHSSWLMVHVAGAASFDELVDRATEAVWHRLSLQSVPAAVLNEALGGPFEANTVRTLFSFFNTAMPDLRLDGLAPAIAVDVTLPVARAEQCWALSPTPDGGMDLVVEYSTDLFDAHTVREWQNRYLDLLERSLTTPGTRTWLD